MSPTDLHVRRCIDALVALREAHDDPAAAAGADTVAEAAVAIEALLGELTAAGMPAKEGRGIAQALANLADVWHETRERQRGAERPTADAITARILGAAGGERSFVPGALAERTRVGPSTQEAWGAALALGCRGPLRAADAMRLCLDLVPAEARQGIADALMGPGRRPDRRRRALTWLPVALAACALALSLGLGLQLHAEAAELVATWPGAGRP